MTEELKIPNGSEIYEEYYRQVNNEIIIKERNILNEYQKFFNHDRLNYFAEKISKLKPTSEPDSITYRESFEVDLYDIIRYSMKDILKETWYDFLDNKWNVKLIVCKNQPSLSVVIEATPNKRGEFSIKEITK